MFNLNKNQKLIFKNIIQYLNKKININQKDIQLNIQQYIKKYNINLEELKKSKIIDNNIIIKIYSLLNKSKINQKNTFIFIKDNATNIITDIFDKQVDNETLVISSTSQHPSVIINLARCKNVQTLDLINFSKEKFQNIIKNTKYKKIFLYFIGTIRCNGIIIQQKTFLDIIAILKKYNKTYKLTIDAVHELFLNQRDYTIFDYIIYTAHAIIKNHDIGILISKEKMYQDNISDIDKLLLTQHYKGLQIIKKYIDNNYIFNIKKQYMEYFKDIINNQRFFYIQNITQFNTFCIYCNNAYLSKKNLQHFGKDQLLQHQFKDGIQIIYIRLLYLIPEDKVFIKSKLQYLKQLLLNMPYIDTAFINNKKIIPNNYLNIIKEKLSEQEKNKLEKQFIFK